ncbi:MAG: hypothetical protein IKM91_05280 [Candidatus Methanomethylophilaceae archaeon]|nr:hypothetical protein [Candidatus Methanomethylophilaceae archaeon]
MIIGEGDGNPKALAMQILDKCKENCCRIGDFIWSRRSEVMGVYEQLFDDEESFKVALREEKKVALREGREEGRKKGRMEGRQEHRAEIVRTMSSKGKTPREISDLTDIPLEDIEAMLSKTD